ncbi:MAG: DNA-processing protein DprA [Solirubrobacteraceae bacterium]
MTGACPCCIRRCWLLGELSGRLDLCARDPVRVWNLLKLSDGDLIEAIGGRRRRELQTAYAGLEPGTIDAGTNVQSMCRHCHTYPQALRESPLAPHALSLRGGVQRLDGMLEQAVVAIVGTRRASDHGMEIARNLARGLAASGVTVAGALAEGIAVAAHRGALEARGATFTVMAGGLERCSPAWCEVLYRRLHTHGCAISEMPWSLRARRWGALACARTLALLASMVIVVEAEERPSDLACAHIAQALGKPLAAVPGRVSSPSSRGTNSLLMNGASLIRGPQDALDLLYGVGTRKLTEPLVKLETRLTAVIEQVSAGADTVAKLTAHGIESGDAACALTELELQGLLVRGDAGRYIPTMSIH